MTPDDLNQEDLIQEDLREKREKEMVQLRRLA